MHHGIWGVPVSVPLCRAVPRRFSVHVFVAPLLRIRRKTHVCLWHRCTCMIDLVFLPMYNGIRIDLHHKRLPHNNTASEDIDDEKSKHYASPLFSDR